MNGTGSLGERLKREYLSSKSAFIKPPIVEKPRQFTSYSDSSPSHGMPVSLRYDELPRTIKGRRQPE
jgi:hypothetical protein